MLTIPKPQTRHFSRAGQQHQGKGTHSPVSAASLRPCSGAPLRTCRQIPPSGLLSKEAGQAEKGREVPPMASSGSERMEFWKRTRPGGAGRPKKKTKNVNRFSQKGKGGEKLTPGPPTQKGLQHRRVSTPHHPFNFEEKSDPPESFALPAWLLRFPGGWRSSQQVTNAKLENHRCWDGKRLGRQTACWDARRMPGWVSSRWDIPASRWSSRPEPHGDLVARQQSGHPRKSLAFLSSKRTR